MKWCPGPTTFYRIDVDDLSETVEPALHRTTQLLGGGKINGIRVMSSNNANEGPFFVPKDISNKGQFRAWLQDNCPLLTEKHSTTIMNSYAVPEDVSGILADSDELDASFSTTNSQFATGRQQAAFDLYAETTFIMVEMLLTKATKTLLT